MIYKIRVMNKLFGCLCRRIPANTRSAVILGVESEGVRVGFRHAEGLVAISRGVVADVDLIEVSSTGIVFDDTEVVFDIVGIGMSSKLLELSGAGLLGFLLVNQGVRIDEVTFSYIICSCGFSVWWAWVDARKFEGVLHSLAYIIRGMATLGDFCVVGVFEDRTSFVTVHNPDIHNGNLHIVHAIGQEFDRSIINTDIIVCEALGLSKGSSVPFGEDARDINSIGILHLEFDVGDVLHGDLDWHFGVHRFSINI